MQPEYYFLYYPIRLYKSSIREPVPNIISKTPENTPLSICFYRITGNGWDSKIPVTLCSGVIISG